VVAIRAALIAGTPWLDIFYPGSTGQDDHVLIRDREPFDGRSAGGNNAVATRNPPQLQSNEGTGGSRFHERELGAIPPTSPATAALALPATRDREGVRFHAR
jgi:hypothetical protein